MAAAPVLLPRCGQSRCCSLRLLGICLALMGSFPRLRPGQGAVGLQGPRFGPAVPCAGQRYKVAQCLAQGNARPPVRMSCLQRPVASIIRRQLWASRLSLLIMLATLISGLACTACEKVFVGELQQHCFLAHEAAEFWPRMVKVVGMQMVGPFFRFLYSYISKLVSLELMIAIQKQAVPKVLSSPDVDPGSMSKLLDDEARALTSLLEKGFRACLGIVIFGGYMSWLLLRLRRRRLHLVLMALLLVVAGGVFLAWRISKCQIRPKANAEKAAVRKVASCIIEEVNVADVTRVYDVMQKRSEKLNVELEDAKAKSASRFLAVGSWNMLDMWRQNLIFGVIYYMVGRGVMDKSIPYAVYHALFGISVNFAFSVKDALETFTGVQQARKTIDDLNDLWDHSMAKGELKGARIAAKGNDLVISNLCIEPRLANVSFQLRRGVVTALVGPSGAGKSSLLRAIAGLCSIDSGSMTLGKEELCEYEDRADALVLVEQTPLLLPSSVKENIVMNRPVSDERLQECIEEAAASDFLEGKLDEMVGQQAKWQPSGGEKQRISIARALYRGPVILLLDEPSSALGVQLEKRIFQSLKRLAKEKGMSILLVTHRLGMARDADHVLVMDSGQIVQEGNHKSLMSQSDGMYCKLRDEARF